MIEAFLGAAAVTIVAISVTLGSHFWKRFSSWYRRRQQTIYDPCWCDEVLVKKTVHRVVDRMDDEQLTVVDPETGKTLFRVRPSEGTAMIADFCEDHCPGGCQRQCPKRVVPIKRGTGATLRN